MDDFKTLLKILALFSGESKLPIDADKLEALAIQTEAEYSAVIDWYPLNVSFHRMAKHWHQILRMVPPTITLAHLTEVCTLYSMDYKFCHFGSFFEYLSLS